MANGVLHIPGFIYFGEGTFSKLSELKGKKAIIVTGGNSMKKNGFVDRACEELKNANMEVCVFDGVEENPSVKTVEEGAKKMQEFQPDWIIALGGGSAMDAAKCMWAFYEHPELKFEDIIEPGSLPELRKKAKFVGIPSTSGTASEITAFSVITDTEKHIKYPLVSDHIVPDIAIVDPVLPSKMPKSVTANTGMDVVAHATEALVSNIANDYTDALAIHALKLVFEYLPKACENPDDMEAREKMHIASCIAGMAFTNASLGIVHSMAHKIGGIFHLTHGEANAIMLPYIIDYNRKSCNKYEVIERILGIDDLAEEVRKLNQAVGITSNIKDGKNTVIEEKDFLEVLDKMSENAFKDACTLTNPRETSPEDIKKIYKAAYYGEKVDF